jgi:hypothetical protein
LQERLVEILDTAFTNDLTEHQMIAIQGAMESLIYLLPDGYKHWSEIVQSPKFYPTHEELAVITQGVTHTEWNSRLSNAFGDKPVEIWFFAPGTKLWVKDHPIVHSIKNVASFNVVEIHDETREGNVADLRTRYPDTEVNGYGQDMWGGNFSQTGVPKIGTICGLTDCNMTGDFYRFPAAEYKRRWSSLFGLDTIMISTEDTTNDEKKILDGYSVVENLMLNVIRHGSSFTDGFSYEPRWNPKSFCCGHFLKSVAGPEAHVFNTFKPSAEVRDKLTGEEGWHTGSSLWYNQMRLVARASSPELAAHLTLDGS